MRQCYFCERQHDYPKVMVDTHHKLNRMLGGTDEVDNLIDLCRQCHRFFEWLTKDDLPHYLRWDYFRKRKKVIRPSRHLSTIYTNEFEVTLTSATVELPQDVFEFYKDKDVRITLRTEIPEMEEVYVYV